MKLFILLPPLLLLLLSFFSRNSFAQEGLLNKLLAPGPLVKGHQDLEKKDCLKCHDAGKGVPNSQCLACHQELKPYVNSKKGFHGLATQSCRECHSEHKGREYDSIFVDEKNFDHSKLTGYSLDGKHAELKCAECHKTKMSVKSVRPGQIRYFGNQATCVSCHKKDDVHFFKGEWSKKDCVSCHSAKSWKEQIKFDHKRDAKYELVGKHSEISCATCHTPLNNIKKISKIVYKWPQLKTSQCLTCHQQHHRNNLSKKFQNGNCLSCHSQTEWKISQFDHKTTGYPLRGKHQELKCLDCHIQKSNPSLLTQDPQFKFSGLNQQCLSCHKDYHYFKGLKIKQIGNLSQCQSCHTESSWKQTVRFDHSVHTRYPIDGEHLKLNCLECHIKKDSNKNVLKINYKWPHLTTQTCETCHKSPHLSQFSPQLLKKSCTECHVTSGWYDTKNGKKFDHSKTRFPLTGSHEVLNCNNCHGPQGKQIFKFKSVNEKFCIDCHKNIHIGQFSKKFQTNNCTECHSTQNFTERLIFDHSKTRYSLEGSHAKLKCSECHVPTRTQISILSPNIKKSLPTKNLVLSLYKMPHVRTGECLGCHVDYHKKQLGVTCLDCHNLETWKKIKFDHNKQSNFILRHKHEQVKCSECHKPIRNEFVKLKTETRRVIQFKPISSNCVTCHKDVHRGEFGQNCTQCHTEKGWKVTKDFHKNFTLTGVHFSLECAECHKDNRKLAGLGQQCITCHAKDDVHRGTLTQCQDCHRQQFWEVTSFKHSLTQFPLRGTHRTLDCMECHRSGSYKGLNSTCSSCHLQDALTSSTDHSGFTNINTCTDCHRNQFAW